MDPTPKFRRFSKGHLRLDNSPHAIQVSTKNRSASVQWPNCLPSNVVRRNAINVVRKSGGDVNNELLVLSNYCLQFGQYRGQTFKWMLENGLGYAVWLVDSAKREGNTSAPLGANKQDFKRYMESFEECREELKKKMENETPSPATAPCSTTAPNPRPTAISSLMVGRKFTSSSLNTRVQRILQTTTTAQKPPNTKTQHSEVLSGNVHQTRPVFSTPTQPSASPVPSQKPKARWLMSVYCKDILLRLPEVKASITSVFGRVLKMDSTKKVVKKLSGRSAGTASWATNVGNENGEVLISVLTAGEGYGLFSMASGLVSRYQQAGMSPPEILYVDRGCCVEEQTKKMFSAWPNLLIKLDVWHFMRRFSIACTTDAHELYGVFMGQLSTCIFQWSSEDLDGLMKAKNSELAKQLIEVSSQEDVLLRINKRELALHRRRRTRGIEETTTMLQQLLVTFTGEQGRDTMGVPLLDDEKVWQIWETQKQHIKCIQDPEYVQLYTQTGTLKKGSVELPVFRCARGSTSLESFHLHLNRFIPGTSASVSDLHFQAFLLEGLVRWNQDRALNTVQKVDQEPKSYSNILRHSVNIMSTSVFGKKLAPLFQNPRKYTGELIGIEYLYSQTGEVLQHMKPEDDEAESGECENEFADEGYGEDDSFDDMTISSAKGLWKARKQPSISPILTAPERQPTTEQHTESSTYQDIPVSTPQDLDSFDPDESVGPDNVPGYGKVQALAEYLVSFRDTTALTNSQALKVIHLYQDLSEFDRRPTVFSPRYKDKTTTGKFKSPKKIVKPGVVNTQRCFLGANTGPAQWPSCNRYVEAVIVKLCDLFPAPTRTKGITILRWTPISRAYKSIRQMIHNNAVVMQGTGLQLPEINNTTLTQWYNKRAKGQSQRVLLQGISQQQPPPSSPMPFLPATIKSSSLPSFPGDQQHLYTLPKSTVGQAKRRTKTPSHTVTSSTTLQYPPYQPRIAPAHIQTDTVIPQPILSLTPSCSFQKIDMSASTIRYQKRKRDDEMSGKFRRKYVRKSVNVICKHCMKERSSPSHQQYFGNWFCKETAVKSYDVWRAELQKQYRKK